MPSTRQNWRVYTRAKAATHIALLFLLCILASGPIHTAPEEVEVLLEFRRLNEQCGSTALNTWDPATDLSQWPGIGARFQPGSARARLPADAPSQPAGSIPVNGALPAATPRAQVTASEGRRLSAVHVAAAQHEQAGRTGVLAGGTGLADALSITRTPDDSVNGAVVGVAPPVLGVSAARPRPPPATQPPPAAAQLQVFSLSLTSPDLCAQLPGSWSVLTALTSLLIQGTNISGSLPLSWSALQLLEVIQIKDNAYITGPLPATWGQLPLLQNVDISNNVQLTGGLPTDWSALVSLTALSVSGNLQMKFGLPPEWSALAQLESLEVSSSGLNTLLPLQWSTLRRLSYLNLTNNNIIGTLPPLWSVLIQLTGLDLSITGVGGFLPGPWSVLQQLKSVKLGANSIMGTLPAAWSVLAALSHLDLAENLIAGSLPPAWSSLAALTHLDLMNNSLTGCLPSEWSALKLLQQMNLSDNRISGSLPYAWKNMTSLWSVALSGNRLNGTLPLIWRELSNLRELRVAANNLTGVLPRLTRLSKLMLLDVSHNGFTGTLPQSWSLKQQLVALSLSNNSINGPIPSFWSNMTQLTLLDLSHNNLSSSLPTSFSGMAALRHLDLSHNQLGGPLPLEWSQLGALSHLDVSVNMNATGAPGLTGELPSSWSKLVKLVHLDTSSNSLTSSLPSTWSTLTALSLLAASHNSLTGPLPSNWNLLNFLIELNMSTNQLTGSLPSNWSTTLTALTILDLSNNHHINGSLPQTWSNLVKLASVNLSSNSLSSTLPSTWTALSRLTSFDLSQNLLTGETPIVWGQMNQLVVLNISTNHLSGTLPMEWGSGLKVLTCLDMSGNPGIGGGLPSSWSDLPRLAVLLVSGNSLNGSLPISWQKLQYLTWLDVSSNQLSGPLPDVWQHLPQLVHFNASSNQLSRSLPPSWANITSLLSLHVEDNTISGTLPRSWGNMTQLEVLNAGRNVITGGLTSAWRGMASLTSLSLESNKLTGTLPLAWGLLMDGRLNVPIVFVNTSEGNFLPPYLKNLRHLSLGKNRLNGTLPGSWATLIQLSTLRLGQNRIAGSLPDAWGRYLTQLTQVILSSNAVGGTVPDVWGNLTRLVTLDLQGNNLTGSLPGEWTQMTNLRALNLADNALAGSLPEAWLRNKMWQNLRYLDLSSNNFTGPIPALPKNVVFFRVARNSFTGSLANVPLSLMWLDLSGNQLTGSFPSVYEPSNITLVAIDNNLFSALPAFLNAPRAVVFTAANNSLQGPIPDWHDTRSLQFLDLSNNSLSGPIPENFSTYTWQYLNVANNRLSGPMPFKWEGKVNIFLAQQNSLTGCIPYSWPLNASLRILDLSSNSLSCNGQGGDFVVGLPKTWGEWGSFSQLAVLNLDQNGIIGAVPKTWTAPRAFPNKNGVQLALGQVWGHSAAPFSRRRQVCSMLREMRELTEESTAFDDVSMGASVNALSGTPYVTPVSMISGRYYGADSGRSAEDSGRSAEDSGRSTEDSGRSAEDTERSAEDFGRSAQISGDTRQHVRMSTEVVGMGERGERGRRPSGILVISNQSDSVMNDLSVRYAQQLMDIADDLNDALRNLLQCDTTRIRTLVLMGTKEKDDTYMAPVVQDGGTHSGVVGMDAASAISVDVPDMTARLHLDKYHPVFSLPVHPTGPLSPTTFGSDSHWAHPGSNSVSVDLPGECGNGQAKALVLIRWGAAAGMLVLSLIVFLCLAAYNHLIGYRLKDARRRAEHPRTASGKTPRPRTHPHIYHESYPLNTMQPSVVLKPCEQYNARQYNWRIRALHQAAAKGGVILPGACGVLWFLCCVLVYWADIIADIFFLLDVWHMGRWPGWSLLAALVLHHVMSCGLLAVQLCRTLGPEGRKQAREEDIPHYLPQPPATRRSHDQSRHDQSPDASALHRGIIMSGQQADEQQGSFGNPFVDQLPYRTTATRSNSRSNLRSNPSSRHTNITPAQAVCALMWLVSLLPLLPHLDVVTSIILGFCCIFHPLLPSVITSFVASHPGQKGNLYGFSRYERRHFGPHRVSIEENNVSRYHITDEHDSSYVSTGPSGFSGLGSGHYIYLLACHWRYLFDSRQVLAVLLHVLPTGVLQSAILILGSTPKQGWYPSATLFIWCTITSSLQILILALRVLWIAQHEELRTIKSEVPEPVQHSHGRMHYSHGTSGYYSDPRDDIIHGQRGDQFGDQPYLGSGHYDEEDVGYYVDDSSRYAVAGPSYAAASQQYSDPGPAEVASSQYAADAQSAWVAAHGEEDGRQRQEGKHPVPRFPKHSGPHPQQESDVRFMDQGPGGSQNEWPAGRPALPSTQAAEGLSWVDPLRARPERPMDFNHHTHTSEDGGQTGRMKRVAARVVSSSDPSDTDTSFVYDDDALNQRKTRPPRTTRPHPTARPPPRSKSTPAMHQHAGYEDELRSHRPPLSPSSYKSNDPTTDPMHHPSNDPTTDPVHHPSNDPTTDPVHHPSNDPTTGGPTMSAQARIGGMPTAAAFHTVPAARQGSTVLPHGHSPHRRSVSEDPRLQGGTGLQHSRYGSEGRMVGHGGSIYPASPGGIPYEPSGGWTPHGSSWNSSPRQDGRPSGVYRSPRPSGPPPSPGGSASHEHGAVQHGAVPRGAVSHGAVPHGAAPHGAVPHGAAPHGPDSSSHPSVSTSSHRSGSPYREAYAVTLPSGVVPQLPHAAGSQPRPATPSAHEHQLQPPASGRFTAQPLNMPPARPSDYLNVETSCSLHSEVSMNPRNDRRRRGPAPSNRMDKMRLVGPVHGARRHGGSLQDNFLSNEVLQQFLRSGGSESLEGLELGALQETMQGWSEAMGSSEQLDLARQYNMVLPYGWTAAELERVIQEMRVAQRWRAAKTG